MCRNMVTQKRVEVSRLRGAESVITNLCHEVLVVVQAVEQITDVIIPLKTSWLNVQTAALNRLERQPAQDDRQWHYVITADELRVTVVNKEHVHLVLFF